MTERKKQYAMIGLPLAVCLVSIIIMSSFCLHEYSQNSFKHISKFCQIMIEDDPEAEMQVLSSLKKYQTYAEQNTDMNDFLVQYGYSADDFSERMSKRILIFSGIVLVITACSVLFSIWYLHWHNHMRITELTKYLEQVNMGSAGTVIQTKEDEFSMLQDEIYKTVTTLYQTRDSALGAKQNFADNLANIAHQLKTPITASFLSLQLMKENMSITYVDQIRKQLERLNRLEESLLTLSKIDAGTLQLEHSQVDIYTALNLAAENLYDLLKKENISISIPDKGCVEICGDMEWTMEAFINLMKNCMEHSAHGGTIHCDYSNNPLYTEILIWDEGQGFDEEDLPHLFERFYRGKAAGNGIGIGLSLARSIFELQNGNITARNLPEGGACFEIRIY